MINGQRWNVEGGEAHDIGEDGKLRIINKKDSARKAYFLRKIRGKIYPGKGADLDRINAVNGKNFARDGALVGPNIPSTVVRGERQVDISKKVYIAVKEGFESIKPDLVESLTGATFDGTRGGSAEGSFGGVNSALLRNLGDNIARSLLELEEQV